jgi:hypothetical protein
MDIENGHRLLTTRVSSLNGGSEEATLLNGRSIHTLPSTVSFKQLGLIHEGTKAAGFSADFIGGLSSRIYFTAQRAAPVANGKAKRGREDHEERVDIFLKPIHDRMSTDDRERTRCLLVRLSRDLRGSKHEQVLQNYGVSIRKLAPSDREARVVIFARFHSGVAILLSRLKGVLGECWVDGCLTTEACASGIDLSDLPYTDEAVAAVELGNHPLLMVTSLPLVKKEEPTI